MDPITLWNTRTTRASDDAGVTVLKTVLRPPRVPAPYEEISNAQNTSTLRYVPALSYFCIRALLEYPDQIQFIQSTRLRYLRNRHGFDILRALIPTWQTPTFDFSQVDPRLWALVIQIYSNLPKSLRIYPISLSDRYLPLLQQITISPDFTLITVLDLRGSRNLTDQSILQLKVLNHLCAFDASKTDLSSHGLSLFGRSLMFNDQGDKRGPWSLRILRLRGCRKIDSEIYIVLHLFPLLCAVDLRGTRCSAHKIQPPFQTSTTHDHLFDPVPLMTSVSSLYSTQPNLLPNPRPYSLYVLDDPPEHRPHDIKTNLASIPVLVVTLGPSIGSTRSFIDFTTTAQATQEIPSQTIVNSRGATNWWGDEESCSSDDDFSSASASQREESDNESDFQDDGFEAEDTENDSNGGNSAYEAHYLGTDNRTEDLENDAAMTELQREETHKKAERFYEQRRPLLSTSSFDNLAHLIRRPQDDDDCRLMLYRPAPLWSTLENITATRKPINVKPDTLPINRGKVRSAVDTWAYGMASRRELAVPAATCEAAQQNRGQEASKATLRIPQSQWPRKARTLKPISNLKPPKLRDVPRLKIEPSEERTRQMRATQGENIKRKVNPLIVGITMSSKPATSSTLKRKVAESVQESGAISTKKNKTKPAKAAGNANFDWESWGQGKR